MLHGECVNDSVNQKYLGDEENLNIFWINFVLILIAISSLLLLSSCGNMEDAYVLKSDGSGTFTMKSDIMPAMVNMSVTMMKAFSKDSTLNEDSARKAMEANVWKDFNGSLDSTIDFTDKIPDSVKNDPKAKKIMDNMRMFMAGNKKDKKLFMGMTYTFSDFKDLDDFWEFSKKQSKGNKEKVGPLASYTETNSNIEISFDNKVFKRTTTVYEEAKMSDTDESLVDAMFGESKYTTTVIMPSKIKSAIGNGLVKIKGNKVTFEYDFMNYMKGKENTDFVITLK